MILLAATLSLLAGSCFTGAQPVLQNDSTSSGSMVGTMDVENDVVEVSSEQNGGKIIFATDDFFAVAENLLKSDEPIFNNDYTEYGKWMDGWETRRKRISGHDWVIVGLAEPTFVRGIMIDTAHFTGNYAPRFSLQATYLYQNFEQVQNRKDKLGTGANGEELDKVAELHSDDWETLIPMTTLKSGAADTRKQYFEISNLTHPVTHLRLNIFPDGGIARIHVYGQVAKNYTLGSLKPLRGKCVSFSNAHFGNPEKLLNPWEPEGMFDGWETARKTDRPPLVDVDEAGFVTSTGDEWAVLKLEKDVYVKHIEVDTRFFRGNTPDSVKIVGAYVEPNEDVNSAVWHTILNRTKLIPHQVNGLTHPLIEPTDKLINHVKIIIAPDGGLARVRIYGTETL